MPASEPLEPPLFFFFFLSLSQSTPDHGPGTPKFTGKSPFSPQPSVPRTGGWHQSTGVFIARKTVPYSSACHVPPSLFIYITIPGAGGDSPAGLGGNDVIRRLLHVGRRRRGRHSTGVLFARPPIPYSTASHAPFSRYSNFSHRNGGGIQQQLREEEEEDVMKVMDGGRRNAWQWGKGRAMRRRRWGRKNGKRPRNERQQSERRARSRQGGKGMRGGRTKGAR